LLTPGFTAEASLTGTSARRRQAPWASTHVPVGLDMAQLPPPALPSPAEPALSDNLNIIYGNWCGWNRGHGVPQDKVDQVCCPHDKCYDKRDNYDCSCDRDLLERMPGATAHSSTSGAGRRAGAKIISFFASDPFCLCHRIRVPYPGIPPWKVVHAPFPVPGSPGPLKLCPFPYV